MDLDLATVDALLSTTRAVRQRLDLERPVSLKTISECLELALQAPTAGDAQNWRWVVVTDTKVRHAIGQIYRAANEAFVAEQLTSLPDGSERRRMESVQHLVDHLHDVPVHVIAYILEGGPEGLDDPHLPPAVLYGSIFPAIWSFQLALRSRGLGTTPLFFPDEAALAEAVGAPDSARVASVLPTAYVTGSPFKRARRRPLEDVVFWDRWGQSQQ